MRIKLKHAFSHFISRDPMFETIGVKGMPSLWIFGRV